MHWCDETSILGYRRTREYIPSLDRCTHRVSWVAVCSEERRRCTDTLTMMCELRTFSGLSRSCRAIPLCYTKTPFRVIRKGVFCVLTQFSCIGCTTYCYRNSTASVSICLGFCCRWIYDLEESKITLSQCSSECVLLLSLGLGTCETRLDWDEIIW